MQSSAHSAQVAFDGLVLGSKEDKGKQRKERRRAKKEATLGAGQVEGVMKGGQRQHQAALEDSETNAQAGHVRGLASFERNLWRHTYLALYV